MNIFNNYDIDEWMTIFNIAMNSLKKISMMFIKKIKKTKIN